MVLIQLHFPCPSFHFQNSSICSSSIIQPSLNRDYLGAIPSGVQARDGMPTSCQVPEDRDQTRQLSISSLWSEHYKAAATRWGLGSKWRRKSQEFLKQGFSEFMGTPLLCPKFVFQLKCLMHKLRKIHKLRPHLSSSEGDAESCMSLGKPGILPRESIASPCWCCQLLATPLSTTPPSPALLVAHSSLPFFSLQPLEYR